MKNCEVCKKQTKNVRFCSRSCSSKGAPRRVAKTTPCAKCMQPVKFGRKFCKECRYVDIDTILNLTLDEINSRYPSGSKQGSNRNATIRYYCAKMNAHIKGSNCQKCNYSVYTELCHIKPVHSFSGSATLKEVNGEQNIVVLCPNHHWELDNNVLSIQEVPPRK